MKLLVKKIKQDAKLPQRAHHNDAGFDLFAVEDIILKPNKLTFVPIGVAMQIPDGYVGLIWDKSSLGSKNIKTFGGVIDAGFRGEVSVMLYNFGEEDYIIKKHHKVAQMLIQKVKLWEVEEVEELEDSTRGEGGFGSTGKF